MIITKHKTLTGRVIELYTPENKEDVESLKQMALEDNIDIRESFGDDPESFGKSETDISAPKNRRDK